MNNDNLYDSKSKLKVIFDIIAYVALCWLIIEKGIIPLFEHRMNVQNVQGIERIEISVSSLTPGFFNNLFKQAESIKDVLKDQLGLAKNLPPGYGNYELHLALQKKDSVYSVYTTCHFFCECGCSDDSTKFDLIVTPLDIGISETHDLRILNRAVTTWQHYQQQTVFASKGGETENNSSFNTSH